MIRVALSGASGRMGHAVCKSISKDCFQIVFGVDARPSEDLPFPIYSSFDHCPLRADVVLDFSTPDALDGVLDYAKRTMTNCVLATTGYSEAQTKQMLSASKEIAIFHSANMSLGMGLLMHLVKEATVFLGDEFDVEIIEAHHRQKLDSPSGTALALADAVNQVKPSPLVYGSKRGDRRRDNEIGVHSIRGGTAVGEHEVRFLGMGEQLKLCHQAESKEVFVRGAERAMRFIITKENGFYDMNSMLAGLPFDEFVRQSVSPPKTSQNNVKTRKKHSI
jgi:4-hydroxy-tetrahydrodipicolinate reductase